MPRMTRRIFADKSSETGEENVGTRTGRLMDADIWKNRSLELFRAVTVHLICNQRSRDNHHLLFVIDWVTRRSPPAATKPATKPATKGSECHTERRSSSRSARDGLQRVGALVLRRYVVFLSGMLHPGSVSILCRAHPNRELFQGRERIPRFVEHC